MIPTFGRRHLLPPLLARLQEQVTEADEILLVDQEPSRPFFIEALQRAFPRVRMLFSSPPGLPRARNQGVRKTGCELVVFIDDDALPRDGWLEAHRLAHRDPAIGGVAGRIVQKKGNNWLPVEGAIATVNMDTGEIRGDFDQQVSMETIYASGGNCSFKKDALKKIGGFGERYRGNALFEDADCCFRLRKKGYRIHYEPAAAVDHFFTSSGGCRGAPPPRYLLDRLHNHLLFYLVNVRPVPSRAALRYLRNIVEYLSRKPGGSHSLRLLWAAGWMVATAACDAPLSRVMGNRI